jgi:hypothetical protein
MGKPRKSKSREVPSKRGPITLSGLGRNMERSRPLAELDPRRVAPRRLPKTPACPGPPARWDRVDWAQPVRQIAAILQVSRQRVYQVMVARGVSRQPWGVISARLKTLDTRACTAAEIAAQVGASKGYVQAILRRLGRPYRRMRRHATPRYPAFIAWLEGRRKYAPGTIYNLCTRCHRIERAHSLQLERALARPGGLAAVCRQIDAEPARSRPARSNDRMAVRRYAEFLGGSRCPHRATDRSDKKPLNKRSRGDWLAGERGAHPRKTDRPASASPPRTGGL